MDENAEGEGGIIYSVWKWYQRITVPTIPTIKTMAVGNCCVFPSTFHKEHKTLHKLLHVIFI